MAFRFILARLTPDALADLSRRIGDHAKPFGSIVAYDRQAGMVSAPNGSRRTFDARDVQAATGWHVEFNAAGAKLVKAVFPGGDRHSTFAPYWLDRCEPR